MKAFQLTKGLRMEYITLNNQVKMPILGLGTFMLEPDDARPPWCARWRTATS